MSDIVASDIIPASDMPKRFPGTSVQFWNMLRHNGGGPVYLKISRKVYYREADIQSWLDANRYTRTDQPVLTADKRSTGVA